MKLSSILALLSLVLLACGPRDVNGFALALVDHARGGAIPRDFLDDDLADSLRRVQMLKRVPAERLSSRALAELWKGSLSPLPANQRPQEHSEHAARAIRGALSGKCQAQVDEALARQRLGMLTRAVPNAPAEANEEIRKLAVALESAQTVRVSCARGTMGLTAVPKNRSWQAVDLFPVDGAPTVDVVSP